MTNREFAEAIAGLLTPSSFANIVRRAVITAVRQAVENEIRNGTVTVGTDGRLIVKPTMDERNRGSRDGGDSSNQ